MKVEKALGTRLGEGCCVHCGQTPEVETWARMYKIVSSCDYLFMFFFQNNELFFVEN